VLISVQSKRRDANGDLIATVLDGRGGTEDLRFNPRDAAKVEEVWTRNQFDLSRYAGLPIEFPNPVAIPVEISDKAA
jgi:hypothetical protein